MFTLEWLQSDPVGFFTYMLYRTPAVLIALTLHEVAHGYVAYRCGDPTAMQLGRLSLNPLKHLNPLGTVFMFLFGVGWAKPVPVNSRNFRHFRRDDALVSVAGVTVNFLLFLLATLLSILLNELIWDSSLFKLGAELTTRADFLSFSGVNFSQTLLSSDNIYVQQITSGQYAGYYSVATLSEFAKTPWLLYVQRFVLQLSMVNLGLCLFNLLPFPPLDGFHLFNDVIFRGRLHLSSRAFQICMAVVVLISFTTDIFSRIIGGALYGVQGFVIRGLLSLLGLG